MNFKCSHRCFRWYYIPELVASASMTVTQARSQSLLDRRLLHQLHRAAASFPPPACLSFCRLILASLIWTWSGGFRRSSWCWYGQPSVRQRDVGTFPSLSKEAAGQFTGRGSYGGTFQGQRLGSNVHFSRCLTSTRLEAAVDGENTSIYNLLFEVLIFG